MSLENVRSYGTEGRRGSPEEELPPSDQVYEYIVFRGSDVKDLRIEEAPAAKENKPPTMPDDPAIVGVSCPPPRCRLAPYPASHKLQMTKNFGCKTIVLLKRKHTVLIFPLPSF